MTKFDDDKGKNVTSVNEQMWMDDRRGTSDDGHLTILKAERELLLR
jgi:hypothetical protein